MDIVVSMVHKYELNICSVRPLRFELYNSTSHGLSFWMAIWNRNIMRCIVKLFITGPLCWESER